MILDVNGANWGYNTAWLFFATGVITMALAFWYLPETARRNSAELDEMYERGVPAWRMTRYLTKVQKVQQLHLHQHDREGR